MPHATAWPVAAAVGCALLYAAWPVTVSAERGNARGIRPGRSPASIHRAVAAALTTPVAGARRERRSGLWLSTALSVIPFERADAPAPEAVLASLPSALGVLDARGRAPPVAEPLPAEPIRTPTSRQAAPTVAPATAPPVAEEAPVRRADPPDAPTFVARRRDDPDPVAGAHADDTGPGIVAPQAEAAGPGEGAPSSTAPGTETAPALQPAIANAQRAGALVALVARPPAAELPAVAPDARGSSTGPAEPDTPVGRMLPEHCGVLQRAWIVVCNRLAGESRPEEAGACRARATQRAIQCAQGVTTVQGPDTAAPPPAPAALAAAAPDSGPRRSSPAADRSTVRISERPNGATLEWYGVLDDRRSQDEPVAEPSPPAGAAALGPAHEGDGVAVPTPPEAIPARRRGSARGTAAEAASRQAAAEGRGTATVAAATPDLCAQALTQGTRRCNMLDSLAPGSLQACLDLATARNAECVRRQSPSTDAPSQ